MLGAPTMRCARFMWCLSSAGPAALLMHHAAMSVRSPERERSVNVHEEAMSLHLLRGGERQNIPCPLDEDWGALGR